MSTRVLIVDDHAGFRAVAREMLEAEGFVVVAEAEDGAGGLVAAATPRSRTPCCSMSGCPT